MKREYFSKGGFRNSLCKTAHMCFSLTGLEACEAGGMEVLMKKYYKLAAICMLFVMSGLVLPSKAAAAADANLIMKPMYVEIDSFTNSFDIDSSGLASVYSAVFSAHADNTVVLVYLQRYTGGSWSTVTSWYGSAIGPYAYANGTRTVSHGQYRIQSYCYVYINGSLVDHDIYTSYVVTY